MTPPYQFIDLSRTLQQCMPETSALPRFSTWWYARQSWGDPVNFQTMLISEHTGTNVDAPLHVIEGAAGIDDLPLDAFCGPAVVWDLSHLEPKSEITRAVLEKAEKLCPTTLMENDILLLMTKHDERNWEMRPKAYSKLKDRPALTLDAAEFLISKGIKALGMDTVSPDLSGSPLPVHQTLLGHGILIIEALANLDQVPGGRFLFIALPLKIKGGSGSPVRAAALVGLPDIDTEEQVQ